MRDGVAESLCSGVWAEEVIAETACSECRHQVADSHNISEKENGIH